jgi:hypothetical protein
VEHAYKTRQDCDCSGDINCWVCEGGLFICKACGLLEGSLTTECPGVPSFSEHARNVYEGLEDFVGGEWVNTPSPHSPNRKARS